MFIKRKNSIISNNEYITIFAGADNHHGHDVGLTPPAFNWTPSEKAISLEHKNYNFRIAGWNWWDHELTLCGPFDIALWNGDLIDGEGAKSGGKEDQEIPIQIGMAIEAIKRVGAKTNYIVRGTSYHVGIGKTTWEDMISAAVPGAEIGNEGHYNINGLIINAKHQIGNSTSPVSQFTALSSARLQQLLWAESGQQEKANLLLRGHIHRCGSIAEPARNFAAWSMPALQGLGSVFGSRCITGLPVHFGFLVIRVKDKNNWGVEAHIAPMEMQKAKTIVYKS